MVTVETMKPASRLLPLPAKAPSPSVGAPPAFSFALPYPSRRAPAMGTQAVAASHALAAQAGLATLQAGGNAFDAAITAAAVETVVEPVMNGLGSDLFAMGFDGQQLHGLNASGRAPAGWTPARFAGQRKMPALGWDAVTVPGAVSGWVALAQRFGSLPLSTLLAPAINYARDGFAVTPQIAELWAEAPARFRAFPDFARTFLPDGRAPRAGSFVRLPDHARSLQTIAASNGEAFYRGDLARQIAGASAAAGGALDQDDLANHKAEWVTPLGLDFEDVRLHELPPNGQGLAALLALGILRALPRPLARALRRDPDAPDGIHLQLEAMKLAFAECHLHVGDPAAMSTTAAALLAPDRLATYAGRIRLERAAPPRPLPPPDHGTVYITAADRQGRMVSLIQSNYLGFGSGIVVPGTGISLQNRGLGFSPWPGRANSVAGGARPYHTIMPGFVTRAGAPVMSFGVMGGHMQPQGHVQLMLRIFLHGQNPQAACDAPRWHVTEKNHIALEAGFPPAVARELRRRGHQLVPRPRTPLFGGAQAIYQMGSHYCAASDPRKDGQAVAS
jgi:gamma-glutamyltranspeptidase/glutathione hydrolase